MPVLTESFNLNQVESKAADRLQLALGEYDPIFFAKEILGLDLNPFQERALWALAYNPQLLLVTSNQVGKTVALAIIHIWDCFYKKALGGDNPKLLDRVRYEVLNISPISRQSRECATYVEEILHSEFSWEKDGKRYVNDCKIGWFWEGKNENQGRIDFSNNSSFFCLSTHQDKGAGMAGKQFGRITYDECVQSHHLQEEIPARIFSRTAKYSGPIALVSTPDDLARSQQYWYHLFTTADKARKAEGESDWNLVTGIYDENIFIPKAKRESYKKKLKRLDPNRYRQVIKGEFIASAERMFSPEMIEGLWNKKTNATSAQPDREYVLIIDWGVADQGDETVMIVADETDPMDVEVVYAYAKQGGDPIELMAMATYLKLDYNDAKLLLEVTEMGGTVFKKMLIKLKPITFGQGEKPEALFHLQVRLRNNLRQPLTLEEKSAMKRLKSYYLPKAENQLSVYKLEDRKLKQDYVMVFAMLAWYLDKYKKAAETKVFPLQTFYK